MIRVTYEYVCDVCGHTVRKPQMFMANSRAPVPLPDLSNLHELLGADACSECADAAHDILIRQQYFHKRSGQHEEK